MIRNAARLIVGLGFVLAASSIWADDKVKIKEKVVAPDAAVVAPGVVSPGVTDITAAPPIDTWRYKRHGTNWWYWTPDNRWMQYSNNQWNYHPQALSGPPATGYYGYYQQPVYQQPYYQQPYQQSYYQQPGYYAQPGYQAGYAQPAYSGYVQPTYGGYTQPGYAPINQPVYPQPTYGFHPQAGTANGYIAQPAYGVPQGVQSPNQNTAAYGGGLVPPPTPPQQSPNSNPPQNATPPNNANNEKTTTTEKTVEKTETEKANPE